MNVRLALALVALAGCAGPAANPPPATVAAEGPTCAWESVLGDTDLGLSDRNASYLWSWFALEPGDEILVQGRFPHARYASFVVQDQDGAVVDSLDDVQILPERGRNPFTPSAPRSGADLGGYLLRVSSEALPAGGRAPNTLYSGRTLKGEPNRLILLNYRNYLTDRRYSRSAGHPLWVTGGVGAPALSVRRNGVVQPCPEPGVARAAWRARQPSTAEQTRGVSAVPGATEARNPPAWTHSERKTARATNKLGPNDSTVYTSVPLSARFGDFILFRWTPPTAPIETYEGRPFPARSDVRYWSISFMYKHPTATDFGGIRTERTVADHEVPRRPDGSSLLVLGLGGRPRPDFVPPEQWVGVSFREGSAMVREIMTAPDYAGDVGRLPRGLVPPEYQRVIPGGVYLNEAQLRAALGAGAERS